MPGTREVLPLQTYGTLGSWASQRSEQLIVQQLEGILLGGFQGRPDLDASHTFTSPILFRGYHPTTNPNLTP